MQVQEPAALRAVKRRPAKMAVEKDGGRLTRQDGGATTATYKPQSNSITNNSSSSTNNSKISCHRSGGCALEATSSLLKTGTLISDGWFPAFFNIASADGRKEGTTSFSSSPNSLVITNIHDVRGVGSADTCTTLNPRSNTGSRGAKIPSPTIARTSDPFLQVVGGSKPLDTSYSKSNCDDGNRNNNKDSYVRNTRNNSIWERRINLKNDVTGRTFSSSWGSKDLRGDMFSARLLTLLLLTVLLVFPTGTLSIGKLALRSAFVV